MKKKRINFIVIFIVIILTLISASFAWYLIRDKKYAQTDKVPVLKPNILHLLDSDGTTPLQLMIGNLHPGETKNIVICVSSEAKKDSATFSYELELAFTENLAVDYDLYRIKKVNNRTKQSFEIEGMDGLLFETIPPAMSKEDITEERLKQVGITSDSGEVNKGKYYSFTDKMELIFKDSNYEKDYYVLQVKWKPDINFDEYKKETDLIYMIGTAIQANQKESDTMTDTKDEVK